MEKNKEIPHIVRMYLISIGLNAAEPVEVPGREIYSLYTVDENGISVPIGLPIFVEIKNKKLVKLSPEAAFEIIEKYGGEEDEEL